MNFRTWDCEERTDNSDSDGRFFIADHDDAAALLFITQKGYKGELHGKA
jgi:hypothetical protein